MQLKESRDQHLAACKGQLNTRVMLFQMPDPAQAGHGREDLLMNF